MKNRPCIVLTVTHPDDRVGEASRIQGFRYIWAYYVKGYDPEKHCQPCFIGAPVPEFSTPTAMSGRSVVLDRMDRYPYVYVCGVGAGLKTELWMKNLHFPLKYEEGSTAEITTYNGYRLRAENAAQVPIPPLPEGWEGKDREHTRCKNFRFAVSVFGFPDNSEDLNMTQSPADANSRERDFDERVSNCSTSTQRLLEFLTTAAAHAGSEVDPPTFEARGVGINFLRAGRRFCRFDPKHQKGHIAVMVPGGSRPELEAGGDVRAREDGPWVFVHDMTGAVRLIPEILSSYDRLQR